MKNKLLQPFCQPKFWWSLALFVNLLLLLLAISTNNIPGCLLVILFGLIIAKYGDPIIFEKYNRQRDLKYQAADQKREQYRKEHKINDRKL